MNFVQVWLFFFVCLFVCLFLFFFFLFFFLSFFFFILNNWPGNSPNLPLLIVNDKSLTFTWSWEWWEDAEMTLERSVHHLSCGRIQHVKTVFSHQVALTIRFSWEHDGALGALEGLLTWKRIKKKNSQIFLKSVVWQHPIFNEIICSFLFLDFELGTVLSLIQINIISLLTICGFWFEKTTTTFNQNRKITKHNKGTC